VASGDAPQLRVNGRHQAANRLFITIAPRGDQSADVPWTFGRHACANLPKKFSEGAPFVSAFPE
jgi:hypothetical protein